MSKTLPPDHGLSAKSRAIVTPAGTFPTATAAAKAHSISRQMAHRRAKDGWCGWHFAESQAEQAKRVAAARQARAKLAATYRKGGVRVKTQLCAWRRRHGLSYAAAAAILQTPVCNIWRWERGRTCRSAADILARMKSANL